MTLQEEPEAEAKNILLLPYPCFKLPRDQIRAYGCVFELAVCY